MVSAWKMDDTITVFLTAVEMCEADRCLPWQWQFFPKLEASHGGWHCHPACWAASQQPKSVTAQGTRWQPHPAGACSADPWRQQRQVTTLTLKLMVCPYWCACKFGILGEKTREPACGRVSWCCLLGAGNSSLGVTGASPVRVCWAPWSGSWVFTDCLVENTCWAWAVVSPGQMLGSALGVWEKLKAEERLKFVSVHKHLRPDATTALSFYEMWWRGVLLPAWQELWSQTVTDTAAEPLFHWQRLVFNFWHWISAPKSCCFVSVHSSAMGEPLRKKKEVSSRSY